MKIACLVLALAFVCVARAQDEYVAPPPLCGENEFVDSKGNCRVFCIEDGCLKNSCPYWAKKNYCTEGKFVVWMNDNCPITCGVCVPAETMIVM